MSSSEARVPGSNGLPGERRILLIEDSDVLARRLVDLLSEPGRLAVAAKAATGLAQFRTVLMFPRALVPRSSRKAYNAICQTFFRPKYLDSEVHPERGVGMIAGSMLGPGRPARE